MASPGRPAPAVRSARVMTAVRRTRVMTAAILAVGCAVVTACASPTAGASGGAAAAASPAPTDHPVYATPPRRVVGIYNTQVPESYAQVSQFAAATGAKPNVVMYYSGLKGNFKAGFAREARRNGAVPFVELQPTGTNVMAQIVAGKWDTYLSRYAAQVNAYGHEVLIGFAHEMNGFWYPWGYHHTQPKVYREAWRHVVRIFNRAGDHNVTWLWVVNGLSDGEAPIREWWPGAQYVDWVGVDAYYAQPGQTFESVFGQTLRALRFAGKPVLIAETAAGQGQASILSGLFAAVQAAKDVRGFVYFDKKQNSGLYHQDWAIDGNPNALRIFGAGTRKYLGQ
jgi:hypothetical protein